jgi:hypothetical protein
MMIIWFIFIGIAIIVFFWVAGKMSDAFDRQERKFRADLEDRWYEEQEKIERQN